MGAVNENCARVDHTVIECLVENMFKNLTGQLIRKALAEGVAHRRKVRNILQQAIPQKPAVGEGILNSLVGLPQRRDPEQVLNEHHLDQHDRVGSRPAVVMAVIRCQPFIQPFVIHDPLDFPQQMVFRRQCLQIYKVRLSPCVFSSPP